MSKFFKGFIFGTFSTIGAILGAVYAFHKTVIEPEEELENKMDENRRRSARKQHSVSKG